MHQYRCDNAYACKFGFNRNSAITDFTHKVTYKTMNYSNYAE